MKRTTLAIATMLAALSLTACGSSTGERAISGGGMTKRRRAHVYQAQWFRNDASFARRDPRKAPTLLTRCNSRQGCVAREVLTNPHIRRAHVGDTAVKQGRTNHG